MPKTRPVSESSFMDHILAIYSKAAVMYLPLNEDDDDDIGMYAASFLSWCLVRIPAGVNVR